MAGTNFAKNAIQMRVQIEELLGALGARVYGGLDVGFRVHRITLLFLKNGLIPYEGQNAKPMPANL
jgi:hypothetical protein